MPHKKNPDSLELIRGCCASSYANLLSVMVMMKGLPLSYNRDMQLDKKPLFDSITLTTQVLEILTALIKTITVNKDNIQKKLKEDDYLLCLDIADYLVEKKMPFSQAHDAVGRIVSYANNRKVAISNIPLNELKKFAREFGPDVSKIFDIKRSVISKRSIGSTNPILVRQQISRWKKQLRRP
jgi:argininosuccinate lyase